MWLGAVASGNRTGCAVRARGGVRGVRGARESQHSVGKK